MMCLVQPFDPAPYLIFGATLIKYYVNREEPVINDNYHKLDIIVVSVEFFFPEYLQFKPVVIL